MKAEFLRRHLISVLNGIIEEIDEALTSLRDVTRVTEPSQNALDRASSLIHHIRELSGQEKFDRYLFRQSTARDGSIDRYFGRNIYKLVTDAQRDYSFSPTFSFAIEKLIEKRKNTKNEIVSAFFALDEFGVDQMLLKDAPLVIELCFPKSNRSNELEAIAQILARQARTIKLFEESITGRRTDVELFAVTSSRLSVFIKVSPKIASHFAATVFFLLGAANQYIDINHKSAKLAEILGEAPQVVIDKAMIEAIAEKCASNIAEILDGETDISFDFQKCKISSSEILDSIIQGFEYYVHVPNERQKETDTEAGKSEALSDEQYEDLKLLSEEILKGFEMRPPGPEVKRIADQSEERE